ncbi:MAG: putative sulfate exporter family transporter [Gemmatimonadaceae bacterium]|nr:putative sulfate exporter family transporter [Gemmatimonadaceae bacterium]
MIRFASIRELAPGIAVALLVAAVSWLLANAATRLFGRPVVEALVLAIVIGMIVRTLWTAPARIVPGVAFTAKQVLEVAVLLLGLSVDLPLLVRAGPALALGIVLLVVFGLGASYLIGRAFGLPHPLAVLIACGNAICGNSAIAAVAPVIDADPEYVASSIAFTALLGVAVVIGLPLLVHPLGLSHYQYGVLAGLTVYAVPQVLAAAFPVSVLSGQVATLVKLVRVLMLGPVVIFFALTPRANALSDPTSKTGWVDAKRPRFALTKFVPWFITGFVMLAALRSTGMVPVAVVEPTRAVSAWLTIAAMAALGLGVDVRAVTRAGGRVIATVTASLVALIGLSIALIRLLAIA